MKITTDRMRFMTVVGALACLTVGQAWPHGGGHEPGAGFDPRAAGTSGSQQTQAQQRRDQLARLQEKIDKIDEQLENPKLSPKKRAKLEKKLKKLLEKKEKWLAGQ